MNGTEPPLMVKSPELEAQELLDDAASVIAQDLANGIANLGHPVGLGLSPHPSWLAEAGRRITRRFAGAVYQAVKHERCPTWQPIATAPQGTDSEGPFFDITWSESGERAIGCYSDKGTIKLKHGYPAVWTIFIPQPTHWMPAPAAVSAMKIDPSETAGG